VTIETSLRSPEGQQLIDKIAGAFGVDDQKAGTAVQALTNEIQARIQRSMLSRGGVADVLSLVTDPAASHAIANPASLASPDVARDGNQILDVLIGSKHVSRGIAARTAKKADLSPGTMEAMLPVVANLVIGELQRQTGPAIAKVASGLPGFSGAGGSPLPLPGDIFPRPRPSGGDREAAPSAPASGTPINPGQPLPIPGDNIPGLGRSPSRRSYPAPETDNPYDRLPDIVRRGGQNAPGGGGSLENVIRSIIGRVLGSNRGVIGTMIELFLVRWLVSLVGRIMSGVLGRR
jgi:hypothetical protein